MLFNVIRYGLAALFVVCALIQLNDPDPAVWFVAYALVALGIAVSPHRIWGTRLGWLTGGVLLTLALSTASGFGDYLTSGDPSSLYGEMSPDRPHIELAREFLGVVIAALSLIAVQYLSHRQRR